MLQRAWLARSTNVSTSACSAEGIGRLTPGGRLAVVRNLYPKIDSYLVIGHPLHQRWPGADEWATGRLVTSHHGDTVRTDETYRDLGAVDRCPRDSTPSTIAQEPDAALVARAKAILDRAPLIDTHNDLPSMLLELYSGDISGLLHLGIAHPELCADVPRLRTGAVGAQDRSVFTDSANMRTNRSLFEALRGFELLRAAIRAGSSWSWRSARTMSSGFTVVASRP